jgi:hypothetical protein
MTQEGSDGQVGPVCLFGVPTHRPSGRMSAPRTGARAYGVAAKRSGPCGNEAVIGIHGFVLATRMLCLEARLLQGEFNLALLLATLAIAHIYGLQGRLKAQGRDHLHQLRRNRLIHAPSTERDARIGLTRVDLSSTDVARVGDGRSSRVGNTEFAATVAAAQKPSQ